MKILLIAGHGGISASGSSYADPGACSSFGTEANETRRVVAELANQFKRYKDTVVDVYPTNRNAYEDVKNGCVQVNFANYDYVFEVHFNSASAVTANGFEVWVTPNESAISVEQAIVNKVSALGFTNRGVKKEYFAVITSAKNKGVSSALVETCFISNKEDMDKYNKKFTEICGAMVDGIAEGFGLEKSGVTVSKPTTPPVISTPKISYYVKTATGKQLGAFSVLDNAKNMASKNQAIVYDTNGKIIISYVPTNKKYLNLKPHVASWRVYPTNVAPVVANSCGSLAPKTYGGLSYEILGNPQTDVYTIQTSSFGKVNIYAPRDNDSTITTSPTY